MTAEFPVAPRIGPHSDNPCPSRTWQSSPYEQWHQCGREADHPGRHQNTVRIDEHSIRTYCWGPQAGEHNKEVHGGDLTPEELLTAIFTGGDQQ